MRIKEDEEEAKAVAYQQVPTALGMFDGRKRLAVFGDEFSKRGYVPWIGDTSLSSDEEIEKMLDHFELDLI